MTFPHYLLPSGDEINKAIEEIRAEYIRRFNQEAVLRVTGYVQVRF